MRRYTFYLSVALLAFGIGSFVVSDLWKKVEQPVIKNKVEFVSDIRNLDNEIKYGCEDVKLAAFWEKLAKEEFLNSVKFQMREFYGRSKPDITEWQLEFLIENFNLKEFPVCLQRGFPYSP